MSRRRQCSYADNAYKSNNCFPNPLSPHPYHPLQTLFCPRLKLMKKRWHLVNDFGNAVFKKSIAWPFLDVLAKLRKATISFVVSVRPSARPSVRMEQLGSHWTDFREIWQLYFSKNCRENKVALKSDENYGFSPWRPLDIFDHIIRITQFFLG
jgi:hypothetical protein